jgi:penicillin-binding protein 1A
MSDEVVIHGGRSTHTVMKLLRLLLLLTALGLVTGVVVIAGAFGYYAKGLPTFDSVADYHPKLASRVYSADRRLIGEFYEERRILVPYERIPKRLIQAFLSSEDGDFFDHHGLDPVGLGKAIFDKVTGRAAKLRGASTITQQLAKSLIISQEGFASGTERSLRRKVREALLAVRLERTLNKEEIIWLYLNQVYLGHGAYGIQAAAENYFRKDVSELTLAEMALIAGLPQAPSKFSPIVKPSAARARQEYVLGRMIKDGVISAEEKEQALSLSVEKTVHPRDDRFLDTAPYFTEQVRRYLVDNYTNKTLLTGGLQVVTTLDLERQQHAEDALINGVRAVDKRQGFWGPVIDDLPRDKWDAALLVIDKRLGLKKGAITDSTENPLMEGMPIPVLVTALEGNTATVRAGTTITGKLTLAGSRWGREPNALRGWEGQKVNSLKSVVQVGDVVLASPYFSKLAFVKGVFASGTEVGVEEAQISTTTPVFALDQVPRVQGSLIAMNPTTGYVESLIGGYAFEESEFNRAVQSCRQPGSAFKPIVYSAAIVREDYFPGTMILDTPITLRDAEVGKAWKPQNFDEGFKGEVTCREAVMNSMNMPALHTMQKVGIRNVTSWARHLGIMTPLKDELGTALGSSCVTPWELTHVYTTFARMGLRPESVFIKQVQGPDGTMLEQHASPNDPWQTHSQKFDALYRLLEERPVRVMDARDAYLTHYLLTQVARAGTASKAASLGHPVAGKTGTTNDSFDTWFAGYTPTLVTTVWIGYDSNEFPLSPGEQGGRTSLPIWLEFMSKALKGKSEREWSVPEGICMTRVDERTGYGVKEDRTGTVVVPIRCGKSPPQAAGGGGPSLDEATRRGGI